MTIIIRRYDPQDWSAICRIHDAARLDELRPTVGLDAFLTLEQTYQNEELFEAEVWVAELNGEVAGFIANNAEEITWTYVDPQHYRKGVASAMLRHVLSQVRQAIELEVLDGNEAARATYESLGFVYQGSTTGKLAGNESFQATGHTLRWTPPK